MLPNYRIDEFGVIHQVEFTPIVYDKKYISYYEDLSDRTIKLGYQRMGWLLGMMGRIPSSVLEIGYGTGTFIEAAEITGVPDCAGYDIAHYPLPDHVRFVEWEDALAREWDLVAMFDALHDMGDPVGAAAQARRALKPDGTLMLCEPMAGDSLAENLNPVGRIFYAFSAAVCVPSALGQEVGAALGAQAGEKRLEGVVREAGFTRFRRAAATPFNMILEARP